MPTRMGSCIRCGRCCSTDEISVNNKMMQTGNVIDGKTYCKHLTRTLVSNGLSNGLPIGKFSCEIFEEIEKFLGANPDFDFNAYYKGDIPNSLKAKLKQKFGMTNEIVSAHKTEAEWIIENCIGYPNEKEEGYIAPNYTLFPECSFNIVE